MRSYRNGLANALGEVGCRRGHSSRWQDGGQAGDMVVVEILELSRQDWVILFEDRGAPIQRIA